MRIQAIQVVVGWPVTLMNMAVVLSFIIIIN